MKQYSTFYRSVTVSLIVFFIGLMGTSLFLLAPLKQVMKEQETVMQTMSDAVGETLKTDTEFLSGLSGVDDGQEDTCYERLLRFHIRANSDSKEDQEVKQKVKDAVLNYLNPYLSQASSKEESKKIISAHMYEIMDVARNTLADNGYSYRVRVYFSKEQFPVKKYGQFVFPAGRYEALRIDIGEAKGHNWWCMMYPALCFVDETYAYVPEKSKEQLKSMLSQEEFQKLQQGAFSESHTVNKEISDDNRQSDTDSVKVECRLKLWDWIH